MHIKKKEPNVSFFWEELIHQYVKLTYLSILRVQTGQNEKLMEVLLTYGSCSLPHTCTGNRKLNCFFFGNPQSTLGQKWHQNQIRNMSWGYLPKAEHISYFPMAMPSVCQCMSAPLPSIFKEFLDSCGFQYMTTSPHRNECTAFRGWKKIHLIKG